MDSSSNEIDLEIGKTDSRGVFALNWSTAILLFIPYAVAKYNGQISTVVAIVLSSLVIQFQRRCVVRRASTFGTWFTLLQCCSAVAVVARGLASTLLLIDDLNGASWMRDLFGGDAVNVMALSTVASVSVLCSLGLERSSILRCLLVASVFITAIVIAVNSNAIANIANFTGDDGSEVDNRTHAIKWNLTQVVRVSVPMTGNFVPVWDPRFQPLHHASLSNTVFSAVAYLTVAHSVRLLQKNRKPPYREGAILVDVSSDGWPRLATIVLEVLCLGLTLPELTVASSSCTARLSGRLLPKWIGKELLFTGTNVNAIIISGIASGVLASTFRVGQLTELYGSGYLCANFIDTFYTVRHKYQPTAASTAHYCYNETVCTGSGGVRYEMLATNDILDDEDMLSDDSGHSSDTDIDAVVAEFKEKIKVVATMSEPIAVEPTPSTGRKVSVCLSVATGCFILTGLCVRNAVTLPCLFTVPVAVIILFVISFQPSVPDEHKLSLWSSSVNIAIGSILLSHVTVAAAISLAVWFLFGQILWYRYNPQRIPQQFRRLAHHIGSKRQQQTAAAASYRRMALIDTVHIRR